MILGGVVTHSTDMFPPRGCRSHTSFVYYNYFISITIVSTIPIVLQSYSVHPVEICNNKLSCISARTGPEGADNEAYKYREKSSFSDPQWWRAKNSAGITALAMVTVLK